MPNPGSEGWVDTRDIPPEGSVRTGEVVEFGSETRPVYRRLRPEWLRMVSEPVTDPRTGMVLFQPAPQGAEPRIMKRGRLAIKDDDPAAFYEFITVDRGNGSREILENFREDPFAAARKAREAAARRRMDEFLSRLGGMSESQFQESLDSLGIQQVAEPETNGNGHAPEDRTLEPIPNEARPELPKVEALHKGGGRWGVYEENGGPAVHGDGWLSKDEAHMLAGAMNAQGPPPE